MLLDKLQIHFSPYVLEIPFLKIIFFALGIVGTKEYRKPEWVTHMEELSAALKGKEKNECRLKHASSYDLSADSLEVISHKNNQKKEGKSYDNGRDLFSQNESFYLNISEASSNCSIQSEPVTSKSKNKPDFITVAMTDYLNSHRHSLSSVMELIDKRSFIETSGYVPKSLDETDEEEEQSFQYPTEEMEAYGEPERNTDPFFILSPIEEKSEPSTGSSSLKGSNGSDKRKCGYDRMGKHSSSCNTIPYETTNLRDLSRKFKTFPRIKSEDTSRDNENYPGYYDNLYSLEPRELDPNSFYQLHTADSQEELQEFLLLESECMDDSIRDNGLASAFLVTTNESSDLYIPSEKGNNLSNVCAAN